MAAIIYEKNTNGLIATGQRTVSTFDSGLVRVDRKYVCRSSAAATHRATLAVGNAPPDDDGAPCIDGLSIFPQPQELQRGDGFTEFQVSSYGRTSTVPAVIKRQQTFIQWAFSDATTQQGFPRRDRGHISAKVDNYEGTCVVPANEKLTLAQLGIESDDPYNIRIFSAVVLGREFTRLVDLGPQPYGPTAYVSVPTRVYQAFFAYEGVGETEQVILRIDDRDFVTTNHRNFGTWDEIDFSFRYDYKISPYIATVSPV
jgi:hypothetical protein